MNLIRLASRDSTQLCQEPDGRLTPAIEVVSGLLTKGLDPRMHDTCSDTPLLGLAAMHLGADCMRLLLVYSADPNAVSMPNDAHGGLPPLSKAIASPDLDGVTDGDCATMKSMRERLHRCLVLLTAFGVRLGRSRSPKLRLLAFASTALANPGVAGSVPSSTGGCEPGRQWRRDTSSLGCNRAGCCRVFDPPRRGCRHNAQISGPIGAPARSGDALRHLVAQAGRAGLARLVERGGSRWDTPTRGRASAEGFCGACQPRAADSTP